MKISKMLILIITSVFNMFIFLIDCYCYSYYFVGIGNCDKSKLFGEDNIKLKLLPRLN